MSSKKALISGVTGQDGAYLAKLLLSKGYKVFGTFRRTSTPNFWRLQYTDVYSKINLIPADLTDMGSLINAMKISDPDEVYNMAAMSFVRTAFEQPVGNSHSTGTAVTRFLESIKSINPNVKFYQASSSEMFGNSNTQIQNEQTSFSPASPYGAAKLYAHWITKVYQEAYDMFAVSGILFNHESPIRGLEFVTRKITNAVARIKLGLQKCVELGNLDVKRDWGFAADYVKGMYLMLQADKADDYVLATNKSTSIRDFATISFKVAGIELDWQGEGQDEVAINRANGETVVKVNSKFYRPAEVHMLRGDATKAKKQLGWESKLTLNELCAMMVEADLKRNAKSVSDLVK